MSDETKQTYKTEDGNFIFVQMVDAEGRARIVLPPRVAAAIYRQAVSLIKVGRRERGRANWDRLSDAERAAKVEHLRKPKAV